MVQLDQVRAIASRALRRLWPTLVFCLFGLVFIAPAYSQNLGEIARQERERKKENPTPTTHVYDNDDLERSQILVPEDRDRVEAKKKKRTDAPGETSADAGKTEPVAKPESNLSSTVTIQASHETGVVAAPTITQPVTLATDATTTAVLDVKPSAPTSVAKRLSSAASKKPNPARVTRQLKTETPTTLTVNPTLRSKSGEEHADRDSSAAVLGEEKKVEIHDGVQHSSESVDESSRPTQVRVKPGDTLWKLAVKYLGRGSGWRSIAALNPQVSNPARMPVGTTLKLPEGASSVVASNRGGNRSPKERPDILPVSRGDTLWKLAQINYGSGSAWSCLARANPKLQNANLIFVGQSVAVPQRCDSAPRPRVHPR